MALTPADLIHESSEALACAAATVYHLACQAHQRQDHEAYAEFIRTLRGLQEIMRFSMSDEADELIASHIRVIQGWILDRISVEPTVGEEADQYLRAG